MKIVFTRREFLSQMSLAVTLNRRIKALCIQAATSNIGTNLPPNQLQVLATAMDEIIPSGDGMPSATDAGGVEYLQYLGWQYPSIQEEIVAFLNTLRQAAKARFGAEFLNLQPDQRVQLLAGLEKDRAPTFSTFVGYVYEAYYTGTTVQGAIACPRSHNVSEDLDALLAPVRKMKHVYREAP